jgi:hypothetical protein
MKIKGPRNSAHAMNAVSCGDAAKLRATLDKHQACQPYRKESFPAVP